MTRLNATAKATLKEAGISQAAWARANYMSDGKWTGDVCGCTDTGRCANGYHHMGEDDCGCLPAMIESYFEWLRGERPGFFDETCPEYVSRVVIEDNRKPLAPLSPELSPADREKYAAMLRDYAGKVVAVKGAEVVASVASPADTGKLLDYLRDEAVEHDAVFSVPSGTDPQEASQ